MKCTVLMLFQERKSKMTVILRAWTVMDFMPDFVAYVRYLKKNIQILKIKNNWLKAMKWRWRA